MGSSNSIFDQPQRPDGLACTPASLQKLSWKCARESASASDRAAARSAKQGGDKFSAHADLRQIAADRCRGATNFGPIVLVLDAALQQMLFVKLSSVAGGMDHHSTRGREADDPPLPHEAHIQGAKP